MCSHVEEDKINNLGRVLPSGFFCQCHSNSYKEEFRLFDTVRVHVFDGTFVFSIIRAIHYILT